MRLDVVSEHESSLWVLVRCKIKLTGGPLSPGSPFSPCVPAGPRSPGSPCLPGGPASPRAPFGPSLPAEPAGPAGPGLPCDGKRESFSEYTYHCRLTQLIHFPSRNLLLIKHSHWGQEIQLCQQHRGTQWYPVKEKRSSVNMNIPDPCDHSITLSSKTKVY